MNDLHDLQAKVRAFSEERDWARYHCPRNLAMAVSVESNELLELYLWSTDEGPQPAVEGRKARVASEMADVLICLLGLAEATGVDLGEAVVAKLARNAEKYPADKVRGRMEKYDEYD
ncbi:MAG TPA: nucleotide pyrophosphohydrolase [Myxococcota bacterium]|nr:nucleotide pyrophosphohydrolase [Myxococcota bacterium]